MPSTKVVGMEVSNCRFGNLVTTKCLNNSKAFFCSLTACKGEIHLHSHPGWLQDIFHNLLLTVYTKYVSNYGAEYIMLYTFTEALTLVMFLNSFILT